MSTVRSGRNPILLGGIVLAATLALGGGAFVLNQITNPQVCGSASPGRHPVSNPPRSFGKAPDLTLQPGKDYIADMCTTKGLIVIKLRAQTAPITTNNFVFLSNAGFFDGLNFHRICPSDGTPGSCGGTLSVAQGGDPKGDGTGGPGYSLPDEGPKGPYTTGTIAMARSSEVSGSQFFINTGNNDFLSEQPAPFNVFGDISDGLDVAQALRHGDQITWINIRTAPASHVIPPSPSPSPSPVPSASPAGSPSPGSPATPAVSPNPSPSPS